MDSFETMEKTTTTVANKKASPESAAAIGGLSVPNSSMMAGGAAGAPGDGGGSGGGNRPSLDQAMRDKVTSHFGDIQGVQVHYNSPMPRMVDAEAYTQGNDIFLAPGQERHLPHELGHVVQQRRGVVPVTERISGMAANTDISLEHEADVLGRQFQNVLPDTGMGDMMSFGPASTVAPAMSAAPVQMAGHKGVMVFGKGKLMKRIEENEYNNFMKVMNEQNSEDPETRKRANAAFPKIHSVIKGASNLGDSREGYNTEKFQEWKAAGGDDYFVEMESLGGADVSIKDFKVGTTTANADELFAHHHKNSEKSAMKKQKKMNNNDDTRTETGKYGLRDSDVIQQGINPVRKFLAGQNIKTLDSVRKQVKGRKYSEESQIIQDLNAIEDYFQHSDTVYIASSVIVQWHNDPNAAKEDRARLIDLAHPFSKDQFPDHFEEIKRGMLLGIKNVKNLLLGKELQTADAKAAEDQEAASDAAQARQDAQTAAAAPAAPKNPAQEETSGRDGHHHHHSHRRRGRRHSGGSDTTAAALPTASAEESPAEAAAAAKVPSSLVASDQEVSQAEQETQKTERKKGGGFLGKVKRWLGF